MCLELFPARYEVSILRGFSRSPGGAVELDWTLAGPGPATLALSVEE